MAAVLDRLDTSGTDRDFADALTPPGWVFWDRELYGREQREIFESGWLCAGHVSRLANPGDYFSVKVGDESIILAADSRGKPNAFYNVCRHRGTRIVSEGSGNCRSFKCPYHAWAYALDGKLIAAPTMDDVKGFEKSSYPLRPVRHASWNGFLFICLDPATPPIESVFSDFPDLSYLGLEKLVRVGHHQYDAATNWKLISENYNECYHCSVAHPQLSRISDDRDFPQYSHSGRHFTGGPMSIRPEFNTMTTTGRTERARLPGSLESEKHLIFYFDIYPNFLLSIAPDYMLTHYLWPTGPESVHIESEWFFAAEQIEAPGFDPADAIEFWDTTNRQDWALCENALRGLRSRGHRPGRYHSWEGSVHQFDRWYVRKMFSGSGA